MSAKMTTEEFIAKAKLVHGDKYDYSKTDLDNRDEKGRVCIICSEHGEFWQNPSYHLQGRGCTPCGKQRMANIFSMTTEKFIEKANKVHNNYYDYSKVKMNRSHDKVCIVCPEHGEFWQIASNHIKGYGCTKCSGMHNKNSEEWITEAKKVHGDKYDYSKTIYKNNKTKVIIICPIHGEFEQNPKSHLNGCGCKKCTVGKTALEQFNDICNNYKHWIFKISPKNVIEKIGGFCKIHKHFFNVVLSSFPKQGGCPECMNRKYVYSIAEKINIIHEQYPFWKIKNIPTKMNITVECFCEKHNDSFLMNLSSFPKQGGCPKCMNRKYKILTENEVKTRLKEKFPDESITLVKYNNCGTNYSLFNCIKHGNFESTALHVLNCINGCPICGRGFSKDRILSLLSEKDLLNLDDSCLLAMIKDGTLPPSFNALAGKYGEERIHAIKALKEEIISKGEDYVEDCADDTTTLEIPQINTLKEKEGCITFDDALKSIEAVDKGQTPGKNTAEFFKNKYLGIFWSALVNSQNKDIDLQKLKNKKFSPFFDAIRKEFLKQYEEVVVLRPDKDCTFKYKDTPNLSQQYTVWRMRHNPCFGNWSDTGAGKSFARDWTSRDLKSHCNLYVVPNALVNDTANNLKDAYQDSNIIIVERLDDIKPLDKNQWNYVILNYEKFQLDNSKALVNKLVSVGFDFVCFDEVQNAKIRDEEKKSIRSVNIRNLRIKLQEKNPNLKVLALSATPIINNLTEVKNLIELLTGKIQDQIKNTNKLFDILEAHKALVIYGNRFVPQYDININTVKIKIDAPHLRDKLEQVSGEGEFRILEIEQVLLESKMEELMKQGKIKPKTVIYSYYVEGMTEKIKSYISQLNMSVVGYTGQEDKKEREAKLAAFKGGNIDVLVGSAPIGTGVDGLQEVCDNMIIITPPWTNAEHHQLIGRIYRQGSKFKDVNVVIPMVYVGNYSWDEWRWNIIEYKRALGEAVMSGKFAYSDPEKARKELLTKATETLRNGIYNSNSAEDKQIAIQKEEVEIRKRCEGEVNKIHRIANTSNHENLKQTCYGGSLDKFIEYHQHRQKAMEDWGEDPVDHVKEIIDKFNDCSKVLDMGCGLNKLKAIMPDKEVTGVDLYSNLKDVIQADMADLSQVVSDMSYNICVFCLSLWGKNYEDYFKEAYRVLKRNGFLIIVEPKDKLKDGEHFNSQNTFINKVEDANFMQLGKVEERGKFVYFQFFKQ